MTDVWNFAARRVAKAAFSFSPQCDPRGAFLYNRERSFLLYKKRALPKQSSHLNAADRNRTGTKFNPRRILSPVRLPVPPRRHHDYSWLAQSQMDGGGFEPPKRDATDLQSAPFGHSGTHPKLLWQLKIIAWPSQKSKCFYIFYLIFLFPFFPAFDSSRSTARNHISCRSRISYNAVSFPVKTILPTGGIFTSI